LGAREGDFGPCGSFPLAAFDVGVADVELGDHFTDDVVEVRAMGDVVEPGEVLFAKGFPVVSVEVFDVEEIAVATPDFFEDLPPLGRWVAVDHEAFR
jgi:hypothetical protein